MKDVKRVCFVLFLAMLIISSCSKKNQVELSRHVNSKLLKIAVQRITKYADLPATIVSQKQVNIASSPLNQFTFYLGKVDKILVNVGDRVKKGQLLVVVDPIQTQNTIEQTLQGVNQAQANYNYVQSNYIRYKNLYEQNVISKEEFEKIQMQYETAKAQFESAKAAYKGASSVLGYFEIRAPFDGVVSAKFVDAGQVVAPTQPIISLLDPNDIEVQFYVPKNIYDKLSLNQKIPVEINGQVIEAIINRISLSADEVTHNYLIKAKLKSSKNALPGDYAIAKIPIGKRSVVLVPQDAILERAGIDGVIVVKNHKAQYQMVELGKKCGSYTEILSGLSDGDTIATTNLTSINNGDIVNGR